MLEKCRIRHLPHWVLTDLQPAFYDLESVTTIEETAKLYAKMQELITLYNEFTDKVNKYINEFEEGIIKDFDCFRNCIIKLMNDYIESIDTKIDMQNANIAESISNQNNIINNAVEYMQTNLESSINNLFESALRDGRVRGTLLETYDPNNETLTLSIVAE